MNIVTRIGTALVGVVALCGAAMAQDGGDEVVENVQSLPSEIMALTSESLLLDVVDTGERLIAVGDRGGVLVSNDGKQWAQVSVPTRSALTAVSFPDAQHGWAVGHDAVVLRTDDGGRSWSLQNFEPELEKPFLDVLFLDDQHGFAIGAYALFYETLDGGENWQPVETEINPDEWHFIGMTRLHDGALALVGEAGTLAVSTDDGATWAELESPYDSSLFGALPVGEHGALIYGLRGNMFVTDNFAEGGEWQEVNNPTVASMFGAAETADGRIALVGLNGNVLLTDATLSSPEVVKSERGTPLSAAIFVDGELLAVGESGVQHIALP